MGLLHGLLLYEAYPRPRPPRELILSGDATEALELLVATYCIVFYYIVVESSVLFCIIFCLGRLAMA